MNPIILILGLMFLAGAMFAVSRTLNRPKTFVDKDLDGEPDEPTGPAKDL